MLEELLSRPEVLAKLPETIKQASRNRTLDQLVLEKMASEGVLVREFTPTEALKDLGKKIYLKNAQWTLVRNGLLALEEV
jgi:hypothetical protein